MQGRRGIIAVVVAAALAGGCEPGTDDGFSVDASGTVAVLAWLDRNGNGVLEGSDGPARNVRVELLPRTGSTALYSATTNSAGEAVLRDVMVGDYRAAVDAGSVGDTLRIFRVDSTELTVMAGDTAAVVVGVTYPTLSTDSARITPLDRRVFVRGRIISRWDAFGDEAVHVRDTTGAIRAVRTLPNSAVAGDSVRLLGVTSAQSGQRVLKDAIVFILETGIESPEGVSVTTAAARSAAGGALDAELVRIESAVVQDTTRNAFGEPVLHVDDGSGTALVVLDRDVPFFLSVPGGGPLIGSLVDASGILVPQADAPAGLWVLKPRTNTDIAVRAP